MYSVIIPCYKSSHTIREVVELTAAKLEELGRTPFEFVLVDDFSPDEGETISNLKALADEHDYVKVVELAKNSGQHNAVMAGLNYAEGDVLIAMDDDMQTHPSQLPKLFDAFDQGYDIVYGYYPEKHHGAFRNFGSWVNYTSVRILIGKPKDLKTSSFWIIKRFVRDYVVQYKSHYTHLQGLFLRTTRNIASVPVEHFERAYGQSGYTFNKLISLWSNIMGYSIVPLRIATRLGVTLSFLSIIAAVVVIIKKLMHPNMAVGWASTIVTIIFFSGLILLFMGLIGEYIGRMYQNLSNDPQFVVRDVYTGKNKSGGNDK
ncbi:MAG: glycosyltransferase [Mogibacterium sp.]|nr:glycosyltransferase [Mogibacterium sp.]